MNKLYILFLLLGLSIDINAQTTQDTIDKPYWQAMMQDRTVNINKTRRAFDLYFSNKPKVKGTGYKMFERWYHNWSYKVDGNGNFPAPDRTITAYKKFLRNNLTPRSSTGNWTNLGPFSQPSSTTGIPIGTGRISGIAFHPTNVNIMFAGAPQGGFWRTYNKGANWVSSTDYMATLGVSDIAYIQKSATDSVIFIATGDRDASDANGLGVYKSIDGGITFTSSNTGMGNLTVNKIIVNPVNNNTIIAATSNGIYVSYNQGGNWSLKNAAGNFKDIKFCPDDTMYVYGVTGGGFYRSVNGGANWAAVTSGFSATAKNRLAIAVTAKNPNIVYVVASASSNLEAVYKSSDKGTNFVQKATTPNMLSGQGWYNIAIESSATDSNIVYVGGLNVYKSTNGGTSFTAITDWTGSAADWVHADIHYLGRNPLNNVLWIGSDGAIDYTDNEGGSFTHLDNGLSISQIYNLGVSQKSKTNFITGLQDNGTLVGTSATAWTARVGGDGMHCEISNLDVTKMFGNVQYGDLRRSLNGGTSWQDISATVPGGPGPWAAPCALHPRLNDIMVVLYKNANLSKNVITAATPSFSAFTTGITASGSSLRFSNVNDSFVFMGWGNGEYRYANILESTPTVVTGANPNGSSSVSDIETSFNNENVVYATSGTKVFKSVNRGASWTNISGNLPAIPMLSIVLDKNSPEGLYVGTEAGVYYKDSLMTNWVLFNTGLPAASEIRDMEIVYDTVCSSSSVIFAATYGRGLWKGDLRVSETQPNPDFTIPATACTTIPVNITNTTTSITNNGATTSYLWTITPSAGVSFVSSTTNTSSDPVVTFANPGNYTIKLKATKSYGGFCTITKTNVISVGTKGTIVLKTTADTAICPGDTVLVRLGGLKNYNFTPNSEVSIFNDSNAYVYPIAATNYMIVGSINGGCYDTTYVNVTMKSAPNFTSTGNRTVCMGDSTTVSFTGVDTVFWNPTTFLTPISPTSTKIVPTTSTNYNIRMVKAGMCDVKMTVPIRVQTIPVFSFDQTSPKELCKGDSFFLKEINGIPAKVWTPSTGVSLKSVDNYKFNPIVSTKYYVQSSDTTYCPTTKDSFQVNVTNVPVVTVTGPSAVCGGATVTLIASGATSYAWSPNTYLNSTSKDTVKSNPIADITYTIVGTTGICSSSITKTINVGSGSINLKVSGKTDICQNSTTNLIATGATTYKWSPAQYVSNQYADTVKVSTPNSIVLTVVGETTGCIDSQLINIMLRPNPVISNTLSNNAPICEGTKVKIALLGAMSYTLSPLYNIVKLSTDTFEVQPRQTTKYYIYGSNQYCNTKDSVEILVNPLPVVVISPAISTINRGDSLNLTATGGSTYDWTPTKYITTSSTLNTIRVKPDSNIVYNVQVTTSAGCVSSGIAIIYVLQNAKTNGINASDLKQILIYPNPASEYIQIEANEKVKASLYNISGAKVLDNEESSDKLNINITQIPNGNYILILENNSGDKKIVKIEISK